MKTIIINIDDSLPLSNKELSWIVDLTAKRIESGEINGKVTTTNTPANFQFSVNDEGQCLVPIKYNRSPEQKKLIPPDKYVVVRKDGKVHMEAFNGTGWAYNDNSIDYFYMLDSQVSGIAPPLGVMPLWLWKEHNPHPTNRDYLHRMKSVIGAIDRYDEHGKLYPKIWNDELEALGNITWIPMENDKSRLLKLSADSNEYDELIKVTASELCKMSMIPKSYFNHI